MKAKVYLIDCYDTRYDIDDLLLQSKYEDIVDPYYHFGISPGDFEIVIELDGQKLRMYLDDDYEDQIKILDKLKLISLKSIKNNIKKVGIGELHDRFFDLLSEEDKGFAHRVVFGLINPLEYEKQIEEFTNICREFYPQVKDYDNIQTILWSYYPQHDFLFGKKDRAKLLRDTIKKNFKPVNKKDLFIDED